MSQEIQFLIIGGLVIQYIVAIIAACLDDINTKTEFLILFFPLGIYIGGIVAFGTVIVMVFVHVGKWFWKLPWV